MAKISNLFQQTEIKKETHPRRITKWIHYTKLKANAAQYCDPKDKEEIEALADLIEADGEVLQDILVRKTDTDEYEIVAGHKRTMACKLLTEERGKEEFAFLPCVEKNISDVKAEFQVYSSNGHHEETPYETMHKLERMKYLLEHYPEEFPNLQTGRMVERLARQYNMSRATVGEYQKISNGLGEKAMTAFKEGEVDKSAAVTLARMPEEQQEKVLDQGIRTNVEIREYQKKHFEFTCNDILMTYGMLNLEEIDTGDRKALAKAAAEKYGKSYYGCLEDGYHIECTPKGINLDKQKEMTWAKYMQLVDQYIPKPSEWKEEPVDLMEITEEKTIKQCGDSNPKMVTDRQTTHIANTDSVQLAEKRVETLVHKYIRVTKDVMQRVQKHASGTYIFVLNQEIEEGSLVTLLEMDSVGRTSGNQIDVSVTSLESWEDNPALQKGYKILYVEEIA